MKVRVIGKKYYYENKTYQQGSVFEWDIKKHKKISVEVEVVKADVKVGDPEPKGLPAETTLSEIAKRGTPAFEKELKKLNEGQEALYAEKEAFKVETEAFAADKAKAAKPVEVPGVAETAAKAKSKSKNT